MINIGFAINQRQMILPIKNQPDHNCINSWEREKIMLPHF